MASLLSPQLASSATNKKHYNFSISIISMPQNKNLQLGLCKFSTWNGLKQQGVPTSRYIVKIERRGRCRQKGVYASLFGVGAPEVLVIGVVALLVFGPKGLAEVARNIGQTIRAFQPTIRELQDVSRELKSTLEREIGLDEIKDTTKATLDSSSTASSVEPIADGSPPSNTPYKTEDYLKILGEQIKKQKELEQTESKSKESLVEPQGAFPSSSNVSLSEERAMTAEEQLEASAAQPQKETASAENLVEPESPSQVADGSPSPTNADSVQEYLKELELEWQTINSDKQKNIASAATEVKSQDAKEVTSVTPLSEKAESGDQIKITEEKLETPAAQQHKEMASAENLVEPKGQSQDISPSSIKADSIQQYLTTLEQEWEALNSDKQKKMASAAPEVKSQVSDNQEAASAESKDQMSDENHKDRSSAVHQLL